MPCRDLARPFCARFSRHQRADERVDVHNVREFPQAIKLDSELNACFLLNEHDDLMGWASAWVSEWMNFLKCPSV